MAKSDDTKTTNGVDEGRTSVSLERDSDEPAVTLTLELPDGWRASESYGPNTFEPSEQPDSRVYTSAVLHVVPRDTAQDSAKDQVRARMDNHLERAQRPNVNSGKPELDAIRADVSVVEEQDIDGGVIHVLRVEYSDEVMESGPYQPYVSVACYYHDEDRDYIVELTARMPLAAQERYLSDVESLCRSVRIGD